eukprot:Em0244g3a
MKDALETTHEITKLINFSPKREGIFRAFKQENDLESNSSSIGIRVLYPTGWTVRADSLFGILENYSALMRTWDEAISVARDTESKALIHGVQAQMKKFSFLFGVYLAELVLRHTDNLSKALQCDTVSAAEAQDTAAMVMHTLQTLRNEEAFDLYGKRSLIVQKLLKLNSRNSLEKERYQAGSMMELGSMSITLNLKPIVIRSIMKH